MMEDAYPEMRLKHMSPPLRCSPEIQNHHIKSHFVQSLVRSSSFSVSTQQLKAWHSAHIVSYFLSFGVLLYSSPSAMRVIPSQSCGAWVPYKLKFNMCYYDHYYYHYCY